MEPRLAVAIALVIAAVVVAVVIERRRPDAPPRDAQTLPRQLDRDDFPRPDASWLVVLFSSRACDSCVDVAAKMAPLASDDVVVREVEFTREQSLHERYRVDAVPMTLVADADGVVRAGFLGRVTATDLWAAVAEAREGGSTPEPDLGRLAAGAERPDVPTRSPRPGD